MNNSTERFEPTRNMIPISVTYEIIGNDEADLIELWSCSECGLEADGPDDTYCPRCESNEKERSKQRK
jgi:rubrerythrin